MIDYLFDRMYAQRVIATTAYDNRASIAVMQRLGMDILRNPRQQPEWFQIAGVLVYTPAWTITTQLTTDTTETNEEPDLDSRSP